MSCESEYLRKLMGRVGCWVPTAQRDTAVPWILAIHPLSHPQAPQALSQQLSDNFGAQSLCVGFSKCSLAHKLGYVELSTNPSSITYFRKSVQIYDSSTSELKRLIFPKIHNHWVIGNFTLKYASLLLKVSYSRFWPFGFKHEAISLYANFIVGSLYGGSYMDSLKLSKCTQECGERAGKTLLPLEFLCMLTISAREEG